MTNATRRWLDKLAEKDRAEGGTGTDYALAKRIGIAPTSMSSYGPPRNSQFDDDLATRLADQLGVSPLTVIADIRAEKVKDERTRRMWRYVSKENIKAGVTGIAVMMTALHFAGPVDARETAPRAVDDLYNARISARMEPATERPSEPAYCRGVYLPRRARRSMGGAR